MSAFRHPVALLLALLFASPGVAGADTSIAPGIASLYVGEAKIVEGTVASAQRAGNTVRLTLGGPPQPLTVSLIIGLLTRFPPEPERYYVGKTVRVIGTIRSFRGTPEMVVHDPADIVVANAVPAPAAPVAAAAGVPPAAETTATQRAMEQLGERLRQLEERVRRLEESKPANPAP